MNRIRHFTASAKPRDPGAGPKSQGPAPAPPPAWRNWLIVIGIAATVLLLLLPRGSKSSELTYTQFVNKVKAGQVKTATIDADGGVTGTLTNGDNYESQIPVALQDNGLSQLLQEHGVEITATGPQTSTLLSILASLLPFLLFIGLFWYIGRRAQRQLGGGGSRACRPSPATRPSSTTRSGRRHASPTSPATRAPSARSARSSTS